MMAPDISSLPVWLLPSLLVLIAVGLTILVLAVPALHYGYHCQHGARQQGRGRHARRTGWGVVSV